jgi:hypothetical protein
MEFKITLAQLETLLNEQKGLVIERLKGQSYTYNKESTESHLKDLPIDMDKFYELGMSSKFPEDFNTLRRYIK